MGYELDRLMAGVARPPAIADDVQKLIGLQLRDLYECLVEERLPPTMRLSLDRLGTTRTCL